MRTLQYKNKLEIMHHVLKTSLLLSLTAGISWLFQYIGFPETNIVIVYLLSILLIARLTYGYTYGIVATIIATCAFNYFFTEPRFTLRINNSTYIITSALTSRIKQNA